MRTELDAILCSGVDFRREKRWKRVERIHSSGMAVISKTFVAAHKYSSSLYMRIIPKVIAKEKERLRRPTTLQKTQPRKIVSDCVAPGHSVRSIAPFTYNSAVGSFYMGSGCTRVMHTVFFPSQSLMRPASFSSPLFFLWERAPGLSFKNAWCLHNCAVRGISSQHIVLASSAELLLPPQ